MILFSAILILSDAVCERSDRQLQVRSHVRKYNKVFYADGNKTRWLRTEEFLFRGWIKDNLTMW